MDGGVSKPLFIPPSICLRILPEPLTSLFKFEIQAARGRGSSAGVLIKAAPLANSSLDQRPELDAVRRRNMRPRGNIKLAVGAHWYVIFFFFFCVPLVLLK